MICFSDLPCFYFLSLFFLSPFCLSSERERMEGKQQQQQQPSEVWLMDWLPSLLQSLWLYKTVDDFLGFFNFMCNFCFAHTLALSFFSSLYLFCSASSFLSVWIYWQFFSAAHSAWSCWANIQERQRRNSFVWIHLTGLSFSLLREELKVCFALSAFNNLIFLLFFSKFTQFFSLPSVFSQFVCLSVMRGGGRWEDWVENCSFVVVE